MSKVFISYSRADTDLARKLSQAIRSQGNTVFVDNDSLVSGTDFSESIASTIAESDYVVVILSANSGRSTWVQRELQAALESKENKTILPVLRGEGATENLVWPLIADRQAVQGKSDGEIVDAVVRTIERDAPKHSRATSRMSQKVLAILVTAGALALIFTEFKFVTSVWGYLLMLGLGVVVGILLRGGR